MRYWRRSLCTWRTKPAVTAEPLSSTLDKYSVPSSAMVGSAAAMLPPQPMTNEWEAADARSNS